MTTLIDLIRNQIPAIFLMLAIANIALVTFVLGGTYWSFDRFGNYLKKYGAIQSHYATYSELNRILKGLKLTIGVFGALVILAVIVAAFGITLSSVAAHF